MFFIKMSVRVVVVRINVTNKNENTKKRRIFLLIVREMPVLDIIAEITVASGFHRLIVQRK